MIVRDDKLSCRKFFISFYNKKIVGFVRNTVVWDESDAKPDACKVDQQIITTQLDLRYKIQLVLLEQAVQELTCRTLSVQH